MRTPHRSKEPTQNETHECIACCSATRAMDSEGHKTGPRHLYSARHTMNHQKTSFINLFEICISSSFPAGTSTLSIQIGFQTCQLQIASQVIFSSPEGFTFPDLPWLSHFRDAKLHDRGPLAKFAGLPAGPSG